jgi:hypothetical protein
MKFKILASLILASTICLYANAQVDSIPNKPDTVRRVFNATVTITEVMDSAFNTHYDTLIIANSDANSPKKKKFLNTNWFIFDLGFANFNDKTPYGSAAANRYLVGGTGGDFTKSDMRLRTVKSSNVNIWVFMQKMNLLKGKLNLKYGLGLEMFNFRYENNITYHKNPDYIYRDTIDFKKNKLYVSYASIPLMLNYDPHPEQEWGFSISTGIIGGYRIGGHTKQKSSEFGKVKQGGTFDLNDWRLAYSAELGLGPIHVFGTYSITKLQDNVMDQRPYSIGIRFTNW